MKSTLFILILFVLFSCKSQDKIDTVINCGSKSVMLQLTEKVNLDEYVFDEGKSITFITKDEVIVEYYCAENYLPHISDKEKYKVNRKNKNSSFGVDIETGLFWRSDGNLIYSNCKASDTAYYNEIFNNKIIKKAEE